MAPRQRKRTESSGETDQSEIDEQLAPTETRNGHSVKPFYLPSSWWKQLFSVPQQLVFAIAGLLGVANFARQIVRIKPRQPGVLKLRDGVDESNVNEWIEENVPSLQSVFKSSWWLPK